LVAFEVWSRLKFVQVLLEKNPRKKKEREHFFKLVKGKIVGPPLKPKQKLGSSELRTASLCSYSDGLINLNLLYLFSSVSDEPNV
jgi:hypothetical protein